MTPNSIGFYSGTYVTNSCGMVTVECIVSKKIEGQTNKQTYKQTNQRKQSPYSRRATITNQRRRKDYSRRATITIVLSHAKSKLSGCFYYYYYYYLLI